MLTSFQRLIWNNSKLFLRVFDLILWLINLLEGLRPFQRNHWGFRMAHSEERGSLIFDDLSLKNLDPIQIDPGVHLRVDFFRPGAQTYLYWCRLLF